MMNNKTQNNRIPSSYELRHKTDLINVKDSNKIVIIFFILAISLLLSLFANLGLVVGNYILTKQEKIYVEQLDGQTTVAKSEDRDFRSSEAIRNTVANWLALSFEWDSRIPNSKEQDPGFVLPDSSKVPTKVYAASYLLDVENSFRREFLTKMSEIIPSAVYSGKLTSNLLIYEISEPVRIASDKYKVSVVATRTDISTTGERGQIDFNRIITLRTIEPYRLVLGTDEPSAFRKQLNKLLESGLIIESISNNLK